MEQTKIRKITAGFVLSWIGGIIILLMSFAAFGLGGKISGVVMVICGLLIIPSISKQIAERLHFEISGGIKVLLAIIAMVVYFSTAGSFVSSIIKESKESGGKVVENQTNSSVASEPVALGCPNIIKEPKDYNLKFGQSEAGHTKIYMPADTVTEIQFSDNFQLDNKPTVGNQYISASESLICEKGSEEGQSINKLYCRTTYMYEPRLIRKEIDKDGNVTRTDYKEIDNFVFDIAGKDTNKADTLKGLKLEKMNCK